MQAGSQVSESLELGGPELFFVCEQSQLVLGRLVVAMRPNLELYLKEVELPVVVALFIELAQLDVVLVAPAKPDIELRFELSLKELAPVVLVAESYFVLEFGAAGGRMHQLDEHSQILLGFRLPFGQLGLAFAGLVLPRSDSPGIYLEPEFEPLLRLHCIRVEVIFSLPAELIDYERIALKLWLDVVAEAVVPLNLMSDMGNLVLCCSQLLEQVRQALAQQLVLLLDEPPL